jgi:hypothetical protein
LNGFKNGAFITETTPSMVLALQATDSLQLGVLSHGLLMRRGLLNTSDF